MILPTYDIKKLKLHSMKPQKMMNSLNTQFQEGQEKVKTKKKVSKSPSRRLPQLQSWLLTSPDSPWWMQVQGYSCSLSNMADQSVILTREKVEARDVSLDHLTNCRVEIQGTPSTLHS